MNAKTLAATVAFAAVTAVVVVATEAEADKALSRTVSSSASEVTDVQTVVVSRNPSVYKTRCCGVCRLADAGQTPCADDLADICDEVLTAGTPATAVWGADGGVAQCALRWKANRGL